MEEVDSDGESLPCTFLPCHWKPPKKCKESTLCLANATFVKHDYAKPHKKKVRQVENFDLWPDCFRGMASKAIPLLLQKLKGEQLCVSLLFDSQFQSDDLHSDDINIPGPSTLEDTITQFKETLKITSNRSREIERDTRDQRKSDLWFSVRRYRIMSSLFGAVLSRKSDTHTDNLVLRIIQPKSTPAINYGIENEKHVLDEYIKYQHRLGKQSGCSPLWSHNKPQLQFSWSFT